MSLLPADVQAALTELLRALQSPDNVLRTQAEKQLNEDWASQRPEVLLMGLVEQSAASPEHALRAFSAVLFRRIATRSKKDEAGAVKETFIVLSPAHREAIKGKLLEALQSVDNREVRNKIGDAVAEVARIYTDEGQEWTELLGALFQASQSPNAEVRELAFRVFSMTPQVIGEQHEDVVLGVFTRGFRDDDIGVRLSAIDAFAMFFRSINKKSKQKYYSLLPEVLNILPPLKESGDSDQLSKGLLSLIELAEAAPKMFKPLFGNLVTFAITVIQEKELDDNCRQNALELMATFADNAPQMCKKDPNYTSEMVTQCLSLMTDVGQDDDDAEEWNACEDLEADDSDLNHVAGEQTMDRLANRLGGAALLPPTFNWLPRMMNSAAWKDRHAALMAISAISEGCRDLMVGELDKVLNLVVPALQDAHPRVRWAGCNALGQMSTDFAGTMQEQYHQVVLPAIIPVLQAPEARVQAHAAAALVNFCEEAEKSVLEPYLDNLLSNLLRLLESPKRFVQEQALSTIATVADSAEQAFGRYYDTLMPLLFNVLKNEQDKEYRLLRAKAMECATLIALAVGKERMGADALALVNLLGTIQQNVTEADDPQASYLLHCWGRMCRVLGADFLPYMPAVMPPLVELAGAKADIQLLEDEDKVATVEADENWEIIPLKGKFIGIKTSTLDDKYMAIELIVIYAQVLEAAFEPWVKDIMEKIALPGLSFFFHDPVRTAAAKCVPALLNSFKKAHGGESAALVELWKPTIEKILEVVATEPAIESLANMYECFYESVEVIGRGCLTEAHMAEFVKNVQGVLEEYTERVQGRLEEAQEREEGDEESEEFLIAVEDDQTLLSDMNKAFHTIFKNMGTAFLPYWEHLLPFYERFVKNADPTQRQWAICIFDDVLEFCGPQSWTYSRLIVEPLVNGVQDDFPANRQAAAYGVGVAAQKGGPDWAEFVAGTIPLLFGVVQRPDARGEDEVYATENASAAIAKILHFNNSKVANAEEVAAQWIETLPIVNDEEAAPYAYIFLVELIDRQNAAVYAQAPRCFTFIAQALEAETIQGNTAARVVAAAKKLITATGMDANAVLSTMSEETQATVRAMFA